MPAKLARLPAYLARYAEADAMRAASRVSGSYERVLVVPSFDEPTNFLDPLIPADARNLLVIVVANIPDNATQCAAEQTMALLDRLGPAMRETTFDAERNIAVLVMDRIAHPIPRQQGVGLARKLGADCAAALWHTGQIKQSWIYSTDADVQLPNGYFTAPMPSRGVALFPFRHVATNAEVQRRADAYELHLRYYKNRLAWAGSAYAFHTLGSTLAVHPEDYAIVRGFPRRNAGEDFYFLNKLAKVAAIHNLPGPTLTVGARYSHRTPFGTGPALAKIDDADAYTSYAASSFRSLRGVLTAFAQVDTHPFAQIDPHAQEILTELGFAEFFAQARAQYANPDNLRKAIGDWFDAFRTLRFIHECRRCYPDTHLGQTLGQLYPHLAGLPGAAQLQQLRTMEKHGRQVTTAQVTTAQVTTAMGSASHIREISPPRGTPAP